MIAEQPLKLLVAQLGSEFGAHQVYLGISIYFTRQSLNGWAKLFRDQAVEEAEHGSKILEFLVDNDVAFHLPAVPGAPTEFSSARAAIEVAQASERKVTSQFEALANAAREAQDNRTLQFLQWFIEEQVEEERTMASLLDLVDSGMNLFDAELHLDRITAG
jgi:bacterioferritin B